MSKPEKKWLWLVPIVLVCGIVGPRVVVPVLMPHLIDLWTDSSVRHSGVYPQMEDAFHRSAGATQLLGDSLQIGSLIKGDFSERGSSGRLTFTVPVAGSLAKGLLYGIATKQKDQWRINQMAIRLDGQTEWHDLESNSASTKLPAIEPPITAH